MQPGMVEQGTLSGTIHIGMLCGKPAFSALPLRSAVSVNTKFRTPQTQVTIAVHLPALDHMIQKYHAIQLQCISKSSACTTFGMV